LRLKAAHSRRKHKGLFFAINLEIAIITILLLNIGFDYIVRNIATATAKIAASPKVAPNTGGGETQNCGAIYGSFSLLIFVPSGLARQVL